MAMPLQLHSDEHQRSEGSGSFKQSFPFSMTSLPLTVLFDWDNTLVDTWNGIFSALNATLLKFGLKPWAEDFAVAHIQRSGRESFPQLFGDKAKEAQRFFYKLVEEESLRCLNPLPESEALLKILAQKQVPMGVVSNKTGSFLRTEVAYLKWENYFGAVIGAGDAPRDKPAADPIFLALENLNIPASQKVWMVGDAPVDWDCAIAAGCQPIAIGNRFEHPSTTIVSIENCGALKNIFAKM